MQYILLVLLLLGSAFFSGTEIAFTSLNKLRLKKEADTATTAEKLVLYICNHYENRSFCCILFNYTRFLTCKFGSLHCTWPFNTYYDDWTYNNDYCLLYFPNSKN